jgi:DNA polymerase elongation subunit (family B)
MLLSAWLFDVYPAGAGMLVWLLDENGRMHALHDDDFTPCFYVRGPENELAALTASLRSRRDVRLRRTVRRDLFLDRELEVLEIGVRPPVRLPGVLHAAAEAFPQLTYYDADIRCRSATSWPAAFSPSPCARWSTPSRKDTGTV